MSWRSALLRLMALWSPGVAIRLDWNVLWFANPWLREQQLYPSVYYPED